MQQYENFHFYDENGKIIFGSLAEGWLYQNKQFFKESTIIKYQNLLKLYLIPEFEHYALEDFTYVRLNEFSLKLLQFG